MPKKTKRKSISKKTRFEVFKRDGFKCSYCGKEPPDVTLEIDHIEPFSKGGKCDIHNYITACFDCNRGKRDIPLDKVPKTVAKNLEVLKEKELQLKEYRKYVKKVRRRINKDINDISKLFTNEHPDWLLSEKFKKVSIKKFLELLPKHIVEESMLIALSKISDHNDVCKYFCGICWNRIKSGENND